MEYEQIKKIINDMSESSLNSLNIEFPDGVKINITKDSKSYDYQMSGLVNNIEQQIETKKVNTHREDNNTVQDNNFSIVSSPMVGTLYLRPSPEKEDFVKVGDIVKKGQVLCIIEAMKLMNEIESEYDGKIVDICSKNEDIVDYGKPLFKIEEIN